MAAFIELDEFLGFHGTGSVIGRPIHLRASRIRALEAAERTSTDGRTIKVTVLDLGKDETMTVLGSPSAILPYLNKK